MNVRKGKQRLLVMLLAGVLLLLAGCSNASENTSDEAKPTASASAPTESVTLFAYVGANLKEPVTEIANMYKQEKGVTVEISLNSSGALLSQLEASKKGDIYMPGGLPYVEQAKSKGHVDEYAGIAYHTPVILVPKGNPAQIKDIKDLARPGIKLVLPDKQATALGKTAFQIFDKLQITELVEKNILTYVETGPKVPATLMMGQGDAGIAEYSNYYANRVKLDMVDIDPSVNMIESVPCATLVYTKHKEETKDFLEFMKTKGPAVFEKYGFKTNKP